MLCLCMTPGESCLKVDNLGGKNGQIFVFEKISLRPKMFLVLCTDRLLNVYALSLPPAPKTTGVLH